jgi:uncharacterized protein
VIRRLTIDWPLRQEAAGRPLRLLAVSDERERALSFERNRQALQPIDGVLGCGDLEPDYLAFLGDAFRVPLLYVRGNHDRGGAWEAADRLIPAQLGARPSALDGLTVGGLSWPELRRGAALRDELAAWQQALGFYLRARLRGPAPRIILSHVPPRGLGDAGADPYHTGFAGYRWLCRALRPVLWLHGHTTMASVSHMACRWGPTTLVNVTGAVLIEVGATA